MLRFLARKTPGYNFSCNQLFRNMTDLVHPKPVETSIRKKLKETFLPTHMDVLNESYMHNVPKGAETHFKVVVVSDKFTDLPLIKRHRMVMDLLSDELENGVHALSIVAKTPSQWEESDKSVKPSPNCRGGFGK
ncbi:hypothetical protein TSAR_003475 [Trichomalopsis sarcophagae]|uniref:BolA n=1 Tax=Trichomalopsis sarcophagae TaxID=543379 RepID=A0A232FHR9_9HYME|nr:hypothetical protein TSAR_003475 [Trichomalopsis sarcophagae]